MRTRNARQITRGRIRPEPSETESNNVGRASRRPITDALIKLSNQKVPNDPRGRTWAELVVEVLFRKALEGDIRAIKEIMDRIEGKVGPARPEEAAAPTEVEIVFIKPEPEKQELRGSGVRIENWAHRSRLTESVCSVTRALIESRDKGFERSIALPSRNRAQPDCNKVALHPLRPARGTAATPTAWLSALTPSVSTSPLSFDEVNELS